MSYYQEFRPRSFNTLPTVIKNLLIINILMFIATLVFSETVGINLNKVLGLHFFTAPDFRPYQFVTYLFMHADIKHLAFNMIGIWLFGSALENLWGNKRFLIYYFITGFGAAIVHYFILYFQIKEVTDAVSQLQQNLTYVSLQDFIDSPVFYNNLDYKMNMRFNNEVMPHLNSLSDTPNAAMSYASAYIIEFKNDYLNLHNIIGASGSLFGILLAFGMIFPNREIHLLMLVPIKAKWLVLFYGLAEVISGIKNNPMDNVAHFAHLGGMLFGFIMIMLWKKSRTHFY